MTFEHEVELEEFTDNLAATVWIEFEYEPGEPEIRYTRNGDGYPGSAAAINLLRAEIAQLRGSTWSKNRAELEAVAGRKGMQKLDEKALNAICELVSGSSWLLDELLAACPP